MKKLIKATQAAAACSLLLLLIFSADKVKSSAFEALLVCGKLIIPSLFPFFVMSAFIIKLGLPDIIGSAAAPFVRRIYGISSAGASALIMGFVGGYPAGAAYIAAMEKDGLIDALEGERLIAFCNNSGPAFIVGVMGCGIFGSVKTGLCLYLVHILAALTAGLFFRSRDFSFTSQPHKLNEVRCAEALVASVKQAVLSIINVCGFVITFSVLVSLSDRGGFLSMICGEIAADTGLSLQFIRALFTGLLELGSAASAMMGLCPGRLHLVLAAGLLSWGGLSVHFQTLAVLADSRIKGTLHLTGRLLSTFIAVILMYFISRL